MAACERGVRPRERCSETEVPGRRSPRWWWAGTLALALAFVPADAQERPDSLVADSVYADVEVDKPAEVKVSSIRLFYPRGYREKGVEGCVIVQFVVNADGRTDMSSFRTLFSSDTTFTVEVHRSVAGMLFEPAELRMRKVRQRMERPFKFTLTKPVVALAPDNPCNRWR